MRSTSDTPPDRFWNPGDQVLIRYRRGPTSPAYPVTVVHDGPDYTALYLRPGTPVRRRVRPDGSPIPRDLPYAEAVAIPQRLGLGVWEHNHALVIARPGDAYDIRLFWTESDWTFHGWYVNLQDPVTRVPTGFDTADHVLDLTVSPEGPWSWKDEHELAEAIRIGRFSQAEADAIRAAGEAVIPDIETRRWPFDGSLIEWRPDPGWPMPAMPSDWNDQPTIQRDSTLTCPACGHASVETMPGNACHFFFACRSCNTLLKPEPGDCCVFCSYGSVPCPPIQRERAVA